MNKQRVTLHFSLRLGNLASNYRICFNSPEWFTKAWIRLSPEECQPGRHRQGGGSEAGRGLRSEGRDDKQGSI